MLADNIIRLVDDLSALVADRLKAAREVVARLEAARVLVRQMAATALERQECPSVRYLVDTPAEFEALIAAALTPNTIQLLRDELVALGSMEGDVLGLATIPDPAQLVEMLSERIEAHGLFSVLDTQSFLAHFQRHYPTHQAQEDVLRWLYEKAEAPGGGVDAGYAQQTRAIPPSEQLRLIVPTELLPLAQRILAVVAPQLPTGALCGVDGLEVAIATRELHHVPLYAQSYFRRIATQLPRERETLSRYLTAEWALDAKSYLPYEPFESWNARELLLLGLTVGALEKGQGALSYRDPHIGVPVVLGSVEEAGRLLARNGHRPELVGLIETALQGRSWREVEAGFSPLAERFPEHGQEIRPVYYKLKSEWEQWRKVEHAGECHNVRLPLQQVS